MGALQATSLLIRNNCDIMLHINVDVPKNVPAYDRVRAFEDTCREHNIPYELHLGVTGDSYQDIYAQMRGIFSNIDARYLDKKKTTTTDCSDPQTDCTGSGSQRYDRLIDRFPPPPA